MNANDLADYLDNNVEAMLMSEQPHLDKAAAMLRQQQAEIEEWKRKYKDMHNLATQTMSRVHQLEKAKANEQ